MTAQKMTSRQVQAIKTKQRIYNAAITLMQEKGYNNTTIEDISEKAKVSVGAFYHYFASKSDIFLETYKEFDDFFKDDVQPLMNQKDCFANILVFFRGYAAFNQRRGLDAVRHLYQTQNKLFIKRDRYMYVLLHQCIEQGCAQGQITAAMTVEEIADFLFRLARGVIYDWCLHDGEYDLIQMMLFDIGAARAVVAAGAAKP